MEVPEYFVGACYFGSDGGDHSSPEKRHSDQKPTTGETFAVDDLLDFSHADTIVSSDNNGFLDNVAATGNSTDNSSTGTATGGGDSCNSYNNNFAPQQLSGELYIPYADMAEFEWLSPSMVEDSFTGQDELKTLHLLSGKPQTPESSSSSETLPPFDTSSRNAPFLPTETPLPGKARSKRPRVPPGDWSMRFLHMVPPPPKPAKAVKKREGSSNNNSDSMDRRCLHCATEKTPQWRTGPMGPKTLCNACGVRYKSGRLVPEYRPAASPTFMSTKHSNSHRKVLELRRQKDLQRQQHHQLMSQQAAATSIFGVSNGGDHHHEFLIHQHHGGGPSYRHIM